MRKRARCRGHSRLLTASSPASVADVDHSRRPGSSVEHKQRENVQKGEKNVLYKSTRSWLLRHMSPYRRPSVQGCLPEITQGLVSLGWFFLSSGVTVTEPFFHTSPLCCLFGLRRNARQWSCCVAFPGDTSASSFMAFSKYTTEKKIQLKAAVQRSWV